MSAAAAARAAVATKQKPKRTSKLTLQPGQMQTLGAMTAQSTNDVSGIPILMHSIQDVRDT